MRPVGEACVIMQMQVGPSRDCWVEVLDLGFVGMVMCSVSDVERCLG